VASTAVSFQMMICSTEAPVTAVRVTSAASATPAATDLVAKLPLVATRAGAPTELRYWWAARSRV